MSYTIPDEPRPSPWNHLVVRPNAPLLASMLCGAWLAWPWFAFNAIAMGSPTRRREIAMCVAGVAGTAVLGALALAVWGPDTPPWVIELALLAIATWKLGMAYAVSTVQSRTFEVYVHYGGTVRAAHYVLAAGMYLRGLLLGAIDDPLIIIIIAGGV